MTAGYSGTPLAKKLGLKAGMRVYFDGMPESVAKILPVADLQVLGRIGKELDHAHLFTYSATRLDKRFPMLRDAIHKEGTVWVSWPKKSSGVTTDLTGDIVRTTGLSQGLVDVKVCAIDDTWSGLKFVWRKKDR
ncbi:MAG: DUF3052 domain-containing protein [Euryarchaeota archaeon]|nr:DUF3052 domain-containing protein [Euryarchaeota archaeon]